jgi:RNA polymerase sigma factor (sigma-70 family)
MYGCCHAGFGQDFLEKKHFVENECSDRYNLERTGSLVRASGVARTHFHAVAISMGQIHVTDDSSADLQNLVERLRLGDDTARRQLLERAYNRLLKIAATIFKQDFARLGGRHDVESVVSEVWIRLVGALQTVHPETVDGFFGLVFKKVREVLLDMAGKDDALGRLVSLDVPDQSSRPAVDPPDTTHEPTRLAALTEFHRQVEVLPDDERSVFELLYYGDFSQAEIAHIREMHPKQVSRLWLAATGRLARWLNGFGEPL